MFKVNTKNGTTVISQLAENQICKANVDAFDRRSDGRIEPITVYFEIRSDFDGSSGYVKVTVEKILKCLGYSYVGLHEWDIEGFDYDSAEKFEEISGS